MNIKDAQNIKNLEKIIEECDEKLQKIKTGHYSIKSRSHINLIRSNKRLASSILELIHSDNDIQSIL